MVEAFPATGPEVPGMEPVKTLERALTWWLVGCAEVAAWALHAWTAEDTPEDDA